MPAQETERIHLILLFRVRASLTKTRKVTLDKPQFNSNRDVAIALTIAGSDSGGGAGIQADLKTFSALGVYGASVITAVTAQNTRMVTALHNIPGQIVAAQINAVLDDLEVAAIKIGMLSTPEIIETVADAISGFSGPIVLDPVMVAKSGDTLLQQNAIDALRHRLMPLATLITPNLPEAATLLQCAPATNVELAVEQGEALRMQGAKAVLMKGGHADSPDCVDQLVSDQSLLRLSVKRIDTTSTHGTGCTLSSAIAAYLAKGNSLEQAVTAAHEYLQSAIAAAYQLKIGQGHGPVHHFHALWGNPG